MLVNASNLNALASNLTNLYAYNQTGFVTQRPCVIARNTSGGNLTGGQLNADYVMPFQAAAVNTDNMWTASVPTQVTIQHAGIYLLFSQAIIYNPASPVYPNHALQSKILVNGTNPLTNAATLASNVFNASGDGCAVQNNTIVNLAVGATVFLDLWVATSAASIGLNINAGSTYLGAIFLTPSA
jgi:hypothetical protein